MTTTYTTKADAISEYIMSALGEHADEFDIDGIFDEAFEWKDGRLALTDEAEADFYAIAQKHEN
ncbi:MAG: hypothetical protein SOV20_08885 [Coriobacteriales bacterium]|nr:hypothetical protein [Coriobacteriales bacterium]